MLPNFLVLGAEKAGTTWLYETLRRHPDIYLPDVKELSFFNRRRSNLEQTDRFERLGLSWYEDFYSGWEGEGAAGDISPMYLCDEAAPRRIHATIPDAKLVAILRSPAERAFSHYWMALNKGETTGTFDAVVDRGDEAVIGRGRYGEQLSRYLVLFPREQIKILIFEEVMADRAAALAEIAAFLAVEPSGLDAANLGEVVNGAAAYRSPRFYRWSVRAAAGLRSSRTGGALARALKASGVYGALRSLNAAEFDKPRLTEAQRDRLDRWYAEDVALTESILGRPIQAWRGGTPSAAAHRKVELQETS